MATATISSSFLASGKLNPIGVGRYARIASWTQRKVARVNSAIFLRGRIEREKSMPKAVMLQRLSKADLENA